MLPHLHHLLNLEAYEHNKAKLQKFLDEINNNENNNESNNEDKNKESIDKKEENKDKDKDKAQRDSKEIKDKENKESQPNENNNEENKEQIPTNEAIPKKKKMRDPRLYDTEKMELVDFGEHTYQKLLDSISDLNGLMWIGRLSPSKCENMFDNYIKIINKITERKKELKEKFDEEQATDRKSVV